MRSAAMNPDESGRAFKRGEKCWATLRHHAALAFALLCVLAMGSAGEGQLPGSGNGPSAGQNTGQGSGHGGFGRPSMSPLSNEDDTLDPAMTERRMRALNAERQKQMVADANKLLKLAKELNDEVASANEKAFSPDQLRKIAEIEKLAKNVREKMSAGVGETQSQFPPANMVYPMH